MHVFKLGGIRVWVTKRGIEESEIHFHLVKGKATLSANAFRDLCEWVEEEDVRLVRKSLVRAKKRAPIFALGEICALSGEQLDVHTFGKKQIFVKVVSLRPLRIEDPKGKVWSAGLGFKLRKLTVEEENKLSRKYR